MKIKDGKFVVTGGASLIGSHVAERLLGEGAREVVLLDNYALGSPDTVRSLLGDPRVKLVRGDILPQAIALRYSTVYGERQHYRGVNALYIIENYDRIARGEPPVITGDGSEVHDYIHVADVARANVMAMASDVTAESFNVATGVPTSLNRLVEILLQITGSKLKPVYQSGSASVRSSITDQLDFSRAKIEKMLGWAPEISIEEGIRRLLEWRKAQDAAAT